MNGFEYVLIALVLLAGFGGIAYALPSKLEKRRSAVRVQARSQGLLVDSVSLPKYDAEPEEIVSAGGKTRNPRKLLVAYQLAYKHLPIGLPIYELHRDAKSDYPIAGFRVLAKDLKQLPASYYWRDLAVLLVESPSTLFAVRCTQTQCGWVGIENTEWVLNDGEELLNRMKDFVDSLVNLNEKYAAERSTGDEIEEET